MRLLAVCLLLLVGCRAFGAVYEVGPRQTLQTISQVPWEKLQAGDQVLIHWCPDPYREKFVLCVQGTPQAPIVVRGIPGPRGELPILDGQNATTRKELNYWGDVRGVIKVGGAVHPPDRMPRNIVIENLNIRGAHAPNSFKAANGSTRTYAKNAAALYVEKAENLTVRNCLLHDSSNGLFVSSNDERASSSILVEGNHIFDNGNPKSGYEHNIYTAAIGITFQFNRIGPLKSGSLGNNLKDRSAGTVIRYNWIEGGNNVLDLVEGEDSALIRKSPLYDKTFVYGNVIIKNAHLHNYIVHYGGDGAKGSYYRRGTLYFYNNTVISNRKDEAAVFRLSTNDVKCDARNNIFYSTTDAKMPFAWLVDKGQVTFSHNWVEKGSRQFASKKGGAGIFKNDGTSIEGNNPGFKNLTDYQILPGSVCRDAGGLLVAPSQHNVSKQYVPHRRSEERPTDKRIDIGAFEVPSSK